MKHVIRYAAVALAFGIAGCLVVIGQQPWPTDADGNPVAREGISFVERDNEGMNLAMRMGHETLPELAKLVDESDGPAYAAVKMTFIVDGASEHIWGQLTSMKDGVLQAKIADAPLLDLGDIKEGSLVAVDFDKVVDWAFISEHRHLRAILPCATRL